MQKVLKFALLGNFHRAQNWVLEDGQVYFSMIFRNKINL